jgi:hypothetical protein
VVTPMGDRDHIRCFTDQVKLTRALVQDDCQRGQPARRALRGVKPEDHRARGPVQEVQGGRSEAEGGEDHPGRNDPVL